MNELGNLNTTKCTEEKDMSSKDNKDKGFISKIFEGSMIIFLSLMVILVFINAIMRYVFKTSIPVSEEYARFFFMWTVFLGVIAAFKDKSHVSVTIITDKLKGKSKKIVYILAQSITLITLVLLIVGGFMYTKSASTYKSVATSVNYGLVVSGFLVMVVGTTIVIINDTIKTLKQLSKGE